MRPSSDFVAALVAVNVLLLPTTAVQCATLPVLWRQLRAFRRSTGVWRQVKQCSEAAGHCRHRPPRAQQRRRRNSPDRRGTLHSRRTKGNEDCLLPHSLPLWAASCCGACLSGQSSGAWGELRGQRAVRAGGGAHTACPLPFPPLAPPFARRLVQGPYESAALDEDGPGGRPGHALAAQLAASPGRFNGGRDACAGLTVVMPCYMPNEEAIIMDGACLTVHWRRASAARVKGGGNSSKRGVGAAA